VTPEETEKKNLIQDRRIFLRGKGFVQKKKNNFGSSSHALSRRDDVITRTPLATLRTGAGAVMMTSSELR